MIYRVVEMSDGKFKCQSRFMPFWWIDSLHEPSTDLEAQLRYAWCGGDRCISGKQPPKTPRAKIVRVVPPIQEGDGR